MYSDNYWKDRIVSWKSVGLTYAIGALLVAGTLLLEALVGH